MLIQTGYTIINCKYIFTELAPLADSFNKLKDAFLCMWVCAIARDPDAALYFQINCGTAQFSINQGLSKHQGVSSTPVTKVKKMIVCFWDLLGAIER